MNSDLSGLVIITSPSIGKTTRIMQMMALCRVAIATKVEGMDETFSMFEEERRERAYMADLITKLEITNTCTEANLEPEFFRKESAYERRNRGAPWYRRFDRKRRR